MLSAPQLRQLETICARLTQSRQMYESDRLEQAQVLVQLGVADAVFLLIEMVNDLETRLASLEQRRLLRGKPLAGVTSLK